MRKTSASRRRSRAGYARDSSSSGPPRWASLRRREASFRRSEARGANAAPKWRCAPCLRTRRWTGRMRVGPRRTRATRRMWPSPWTTPSCRPSRPRSAGAHVAGAGHRAPPQANGAEAAGGEQEIVTLRRDERGRVQLGVPGRGRGSLKPPLGRLHVSQVGMPGGAGGAAAQRPRRSRLSCWRRAGWATARRSQRTSRTSLAERTRGGRRCRRRDRSTGCTCPRSICSLRRRRCRPRAARRDAPERGRPDGAARLPGGRPDERSRGGARRGARRPRRGVGIGRRWRRWGGASALDGGGAPPDPVPIEPREQHHRAPARAARHPRRRGR